MGAENFIAIHASSDSGSGNENNELHSSNTELSEVDSQPNSSQLKEDIINKDNLGQGEGDGENEGGQYVQEMELGKELINKAPILQESIKLAETISTAEKVNAINSVVNNESGCSLAQNNSYRIADSPISGVKRARMTLVDREPSIHVVYNSLTRTSKRKLEELLQKWSAWHAQHDFSTNDSDETLESGEETYFPALHVGLEKASIVSYWVDNQTRKEHSKFVPLNDDTVPLYDRGFPLGLTSSDGSTNVERGMETLEASRCFNCGSYNHSLKECPKPRDNVAVNNARKQHNSKRGLTAGPRNPSRYYQNSPGGKYDGLRPGFLGSETRQLLGLGELDPPPWLHRMREIGYPPGYFDPEYDDQPSGITIFADEKMEEHEDGEIFETENPEAPKKMSVEFPGINAPIPENADESRWASLRDASSFYSSKNQFHYVTNHSSEAISRGQYSDPRRSRDYRDDGPPGCNPGVDSSMIPRHSGYDPNYASESHSPRGNPIPRSPSLGRSFSDRGRSPLVHESSPNHSPHNSLPYSSPNTRHSPRSYSSPSFENWVYDSHHSSSSDFSSQRKDRHDRHHHHHHHRK